MKWKYDQRKLFNNETMSLLGNVYILFFILYNSYIILIYLYSKVKSIILALSYKHHILYNTKNDFFLNMVKVFIDIH